MWWTVQPRQGRTGGATRETDTPMVQGATEREAMGRGDSTFLESRERQLGLWRMTLHARYWPSPPVPCCALLPVAGPQHWWLVAALVGIALPYNAAQRLDHAAQRRASAPRGLQRPGAGPRLPGLRCPTLIQPILMVMLAINATSSVAFGRKVAAEAAARRCPRAPSASPGHHPAHRGVGVAAGLPGDLGVPHHGGGQRRRDRARRARPLRRAHGRHRRRGVGAAHPPPHHALREPPRRGAAGLPGVGVA